MSEIDIHKKDFLRLNFSANWAFVTAIRELTKEILGNYFHDKEAVSIVVMCITELIENTIKYSADGIANVKMDFDFENERIFCKFSNKANRENITKLKEEIATLNTDTADSIYQERLSRAAIRTDGKSQLGLARVVLDGKTNLDISYLDEAVEINVDFSITKIQQARYDRH